jgi:hypothetical protein
MPFNNTLKKPSEISEIQVMRLEIPVAQLEVIFHNLPVMR